MGKTADFEKEKKKYTRIKKIKRLFAILIMAVAVVVIYAFRVELAAQGLGVFISDTVAYMINNEGFPVTIDSRPRQLVSSGNRAVLLTESSISEYNAAGNKVLEKRIAGQNVIAKSAGKYLLSYQLGGYDVEIRTGDTIIYTHRFNDAIYGADIAANGAFAVSTEVTGAQSQVESFDSNYSRQFVWLSTDRIIHCVDLDDKAQYIAVGGVGLSEGVLDSAISIFELQTGNERCSLELDDEMLLAMRLFEDGSASAITDKSTIAISSNGKLKGEFSFEGEPISAFDIAANGEMAVAIGDYDSKHEQRIIRLNASASQLGDSRSANKAESIFVYGDDTLLFVGERVIRFDSNMGRVASTETPEAVKVSPAGKYLYYATSRQIFRTAIK